MVNNFKYLGVTITNKGKYKLTIKDNIEKARKAFYAQLRQVRQNYIPLDCHIDLFIKTIEPILLYGAEIWGYENHKHLEQFRLRCLKTILNVKTSTPDYMVYGELGIHPLEETIKLRMINYWGNLITGKQSKLSAILYNTSRQNTFSIQPVFKWNEAIKKILDELGFSLLWSTKTPELLYPFKATEIKQRLSDQSQQKILAVSDSTKKRNYIFLLLERRLAPYIEILDKRDALCLLRFRTSNHKLPIETGRYKNVEYKDRHCTTCKTLGDEFHFLFICPLLHESRKKFIPSKKSVMTGRWCSIVTKPN